MIRDALETILNEFRRRYGVEVDIDIRVHNLADGTERPTRELAERIVSELAKEIGGTKPRHASYGAGCQKAAWVDTWVDTQKGTITISAFYPSYQTEGENARDC